MASYQDLRSLWLGLESPADAALIDSLWVDDWLLLAGLPTVGEPIAAVVEFRTE
jgi:hypothetical protein